MAEEAVLDEAAAWGLVRSVAHAASSGPAPHAVEHEGARLDVDGAGGWTASVPTTETAQALLDLYLRIVVEPEIGIGQLGQSLDGRIALPNGQSHYVTGPEDILRLHRLRALVDAVIVGAGTVAADDPRLSVRHAEGEDPVRVVLDPGGRLDPGRRVFTDGAAPTLWVQAQDAGSDGNGKVAAHPDIVTLPVSYMGGFHPGEVLDVLRARGLRRVLVEGGGVTVSGFLAAGLLDRLHVTVAPLLIGSGRPSITLPAIETLDEGLRPPCRHVPLGDDLLFDLDLR